MRKLFWAAALGGGLYWASKQPGGIPAVWGKFSGSLKKVQDSNDPLGTLQSEFNSASAATTAATPIEPATPYTPLPEQPAPATL